VREKLKKDKEENERLVREKLNKDKEENERLVREKLKKDREENERLVREKLKKDREESERLKREQNEKERLIYNNNDNIIYKSSTIVTATHNFIAEDYDQLDIEKDEVLVVTDWNYKEGWVYGHRKNNENEKGIFPKVFVKILNYENTEELNSEITSEYKSKFENKINQLRSLNESIKIVKWILSIHMNLLK